MAPKKGARKVQTTLRLPRDLYEQACSRAEANHGGAASLNDFIVAALNAYLQMLQRRQVDAAFAGMANDASYQKQAVGLAESFAESDWEAFETVVEPSGERNAAR